ncbi:hypothetical protein EV144_1011472 [Flavobacterium sp. 270]|uniref:hypothetical protein n=1 Tax=Flavobacterium sp. 270 TaxID=2512114 RepID=UPI0010DC2B85|nr:hypothetical protein [Flavobacterium sp. 270]TDW52779.1 hypothetical protein EV144_1011472 [Flavobacterium sp. 270]
MAEIKIEKKKPIWPWVLAVLLIAALIYFIFVRDNEAQVENRMQIENTTSADSTGN